jgi:hypothetical protein
MEGQARGNTGGLSALTTQGILGALLHGTEWRSDGVGTTSGFAKTKLALRQCDAAYHCVLPRLCVPARAVGGTGVVRGRAFLRFPVRMTSPTSIEDDPADSAALTMLPGPAQSAVTPTDGCSSQFRASCKRLVSSRAIRTRSLGEGGGSGRWERRGREGKGHGQLGG